MRIGRNSGEQHCNGEDELSQSFHILISLFEAVLQCRRRLPPVLFVHFELPFAHYIAKLRFFLTTLFGKAFLTFKAWLAGGL